MSNANRYLHSTGNIIIFTQGHLKRDLGPRDLSSNIWFAVFEAFEFNEIHHIPNCKYYILLPKIVRLLETVTLHTRPCTSLPPGLGVSRSLDPAFPVISVLESKEKNLTDSFDYRGFFLLTMLKKPFSELTQRQKSTNVFICRGVHQ